MIVAGSLVGGLVAAIALVAIPFAGEGESTVTGALLLGFAFGWALMAVLSTRFTDRPERWAAVPAAAMGVTAIGLLVLAPDAAAITTLGWVWPPLLLALVVWMTVQVRRQPPSRTRPWLLYPVFGVLALVAAGGAYETLRNSTDSPAALAPASDSSTSAGTGSPSTAPDPGARP